jgi:phage baseplate assembly protein W
MAATITNPSDFLGTGWTFPPTFDRDRGEVILSSDVENIKQSLWILFSTRLGERIMLSTFGADLWPLVFSGLTTTLANEIKWLIGKAVLDWEPRIDLTDVTIEAMATTRGRLAITVEFVVRQTNARSNLVYPFYIEEGTLPPAPI